jgi:hypothetical protein
MKRLKLEKRHKNTSDLYKYNTLTKVVAIPQQQSTGIFITSIQELKEPHGLYPFLYRNEYFRWCYFCKANDDRSGYDGLTYNNNVNYSGHNYYVEYSSVNASFNSDLLQKRVRYYESTN